MITRIDKAKLDLGRMETSLRGRIGRVARGPSLTSILQKSFGERPPRRADISRDLFLVSLFGPFGLVGRLKKKIARASGHDAEVVPAEDITAMAMPHMPGKQDGNLVFLGAEFARKNCEKPDVIAGVLAHEWGHLVSEFPNGLDPDNLSWEEIFELRKLEESYADAYAGRLLYLVGHRPEGLVRHFEENTKGKSPKYFDLETRKRVIVAAYEAQVAKHTLAARLFKGSGNLFTSRVIAVA